LTGSLWNDEQERPLQHLRIIDLSIMVTGAYLTRVLAQYGADVIKIESLPNGDPLRDPATTHLFELLNQGKRSVAVNLKSAEGVEIVRQLAGEADVFVENFREGVMDSLGLGYADISEENPDLVYLSLRGMSGKNVVHAAHDLNFVAASGVGEWFLESGTPNYSTQFGDVIGGALMPALKLMFHLANPARRGMHLVSHMNENFRSLFLPRAYETFKQEGVAKGQPKPGLQGMLDGSQPHSRYYKCRDGLWVSLNAVQKKHWEAFCDVVDRPAWKTRMGDATLMPEIEKLFLDAPSTYWEALATNREICLFRVIPWEEHISFSQARPQFSMDPLTWCGFAPNPNLPATPKLGQDSFALVHSLGIPNKNIADWIQNGVLFQPDDKK